MRKPRERERGWRYLGEEAFGSTGDGRRIEGAVDELSTTLPICPVLIYTEEVNNQSMTKQEEHQLIKRAQSGSKRAQTKLLLKYERLCHKLARKFAFTAPNHDHDDLFQEAQIGLLSAIQTFDETVGSAFMTWAFYKVRGAVTSAGRLDRKQPRFPISIEDSDRAYNVEYENEPEIRDDLPPGLALRLIDDCAGGLDSKRAKIVIDRYGLFGYPQLRNCEVCEKYNTNKHAVVSHTCSFKRKVRQLYPELAQFV